MDLKGAWVKLRDGDAITDNELTAMIAQAEAAMPYLRSRPDYGLACKDTAVTLDSLKGYQTARKELKAYRATIKVSK